MSAMVISSLLVVLLSVPSNVLAAKSPSSLDDLQLNQLREFAVPDWHQKLLQADSSHAIKLHQELVTEDSDVEFGLNEPFYPTPFHILPEKKPFHINEVEHWYEKHSNGSADGYYRRSSCPAVNALANRGYINRNGRNITYSELAYAVREVWNFGDDNVGRLHCIILNGPLMELQSMLVIAPTFAMHGWPRTVDLDWFNVGYLVQVLSSVPVLTLARTTMSNM